MRRKDFFEEFFSSFVGSERLGMAKNSANLAAGRQFWRIYQYSATGLLSNRTVWLRLFHTSMNVWGKT